jgi:hypothetical protein
VDGRVGSSGVERRDLVSYAAHINYTNEGAWPTRVAGYRQTNTMKLYKSVYGLRYLAR